MIGILPKWVPTIIYAKNLDNRCLVGRIAPDRYYYFMTGSIESLVEIYELIEINILINTKPMNEINERNVSVIND